MSVEIAFGSANAETGIISITADTVANTSVTTPAETDGRIFVLQRP